MAETVKDLVMWDGAEPLEVKEGLRFSMTDEGFRIEVTEYHCRGLIIPWDVIRGLPLKTRKSGGVHEVEEAGDIEREDADENSIQSMVNEKEYNVVS